MVLGFEAEGLGSTLSLGSTNLDSVFAGALVGSGGLNKVGTGVLELAGISNLGGASQVSAFILQKMKEISSAKKYRTEPALRSSIIPI